MASRARSSNAQLSVKLRLLIDECFDGPLSERIAKQKRGFCSHLEILDNNHELGNTGTKDEQVVVYAKRKNLIVVTVEKRLDDLRFPLCTHPGIIVVNTKRRHPDTQFEALAAFMRSGHRKIAHHTVVTIRDDFFEVTYLTPDRVQQTTKLKFSDPWPDDIRLFRIAATQLPKRQRYEK